MRANIDLSKYVYIKMYAIQRENFNKIHHNSFCDLHSEHGICAKESELYCSVAATDVWRGTVSKFLAAKNDFVLNFANCSYNAFVYDAGKPWRYNISADDFRMGNDALEHDDHCMQRFCLKIKRY